MTSEEQEEYNENNLTNEFKDEYSFDDYNNITEKVHTETDTTKNTTVVSTYDKTRLSTQTENGSEITYTYDDNGNMVTKTAVNGELSAVTEFSYDTFDRTASITLGNGVTTSFAYNTDSDRISKTTGNTITETVLDNGSVCADLVSGNNALTTKVYSDNNSVYCQNGVFTYNIINYKGDLVATSESNDVDFRYNAYGIKLTDNSTNNPIGYRNYYYDSETGLYYLKARYYDPTTGQFTQEDTVHNDNLQYNLYGYCSGNPVLYVDPSGHDAIMMIDNQGASNFGHIALMLESNDVWFYCSISEKENSIVDFAYIDYDFNKDSSIRLICNYIERVNNYRKIYCTGSPVMKIAGFNRDKNGKVEKDKNGKPTLIYDQKIYFYGNFSDAMLFFKDKYYLNNNFKYKLLTNNCSIIACKTMTKGKFKTNNKDYRKAFKILSSDPRPKHAFLAIKHFQKYINAYNNAGFWKQVKMNISGENPWEYIIGC